MKKFSVILIILLSVACGRESSPEGRSQIRDEELLRKIDTLKDQNRALMDSISEINKEIRKLRNK